MKTKKLTIYIFLMFTLLFTFIAKAETCPTPDKINIDCDEDYCIYFAEGGWFFESDKLTEESPIPTKFISAHFANNYFDRISMANDRTSEDYCAYKLNEANSTILKFRHMTRKMDLTEEQKINWLPTGKNSYTCTKNTEKCLFTLRPWDYEKNSNV